ncbi:threonine-phosphate decarboxylase CobD [Pinisolibacter sp.]|uniref:threonine-phosphate decarboxylase CobD n=1 Tax=Pinisolibacter sp. TaxID=2172024 RepID=UPI002FDE44E0
MEPSGNRWAGTDASPVYHGGDLAQVRNRFPDAPEPWIDLSTGINPCPYPIPPIPAEAWTRLPEAAEVSDLERVAAEAYGAHDRFHVAATPGTQAAIQMLPRLLAGARVGILGFTYQEHARVWREAGREVEIVERATDLARFDIGLLVNPNNPDGRMVSTDELAALALDMAAAGRRLIVDEAFVDVMEEGASLAPRLPMGRAIVLRSFGKTWGLAGLRLGFCLGDADFTRSMRAAFGPWAVSGPAIAIGRAALADRPWLEAAVARLKRDADRLDALTTAAGCPTVGGTPLYRLIRSSNAERFAEHLAEAGIHVRRFPHAPDLLRLGLPGEAAAWTRLEAALRSASSQQRARSDYAG